MPKPTNVIMSVAAVALTATVLGVGYLLVADAPEVSVGGLATAASQAADESPLDEPPPSASGASLATAPAAPEFSPGEGLAQVQAKLAAAHYVLPQAPRAVGSHQEAYAESWEEAGAPRAYVLHFRTVAGRHSLLRVESNPDGVAMRRALGGDALQLSVQAERQAKAFVGGQHLKLEPTGPGGVALLGGRFRLDLRDADGNATDAGRLVGGDTGPRRVPLLGHWAHARQLVWALLAEDGKRLVLVGQLPHSGLDHLLRLRLAANGQGYVAEQP